MPDLNHIREPLRPGNPPRSIATAVLEAKAERLDLRTLPHVADPKWGVFHYIFAGGIRWEKRWPLFILMRHSNQLSCKYVSTLINLRMNGDLYRPVRGLFYTGSEDLFSLMGIKVRWKCCRLFFPPLHHFQNFFSDVSLFPFHVIRIVNETLCGKQSDLLRPQFSLKVNCSRDPVCHLC